VLRFVTAEDIKDAIDTLLLAKLEAA